MKNIKFKCWDLKLERFVNIYSHKIGVMLTEAGLVMSTGWDSYDFPTWDMENVDLNRYKFLQFTGLVDKNNKEYYIGDIAKFDNGDMFVLKLEDWLEVYCDWIGDPKCEDQTRDLYRISNAKIIGNIHQNPELIR